MIRPANLADAAVLAALAERTFRETFAVANSAADMESHCARSFSPEIQRAELSDPSRVTILAEVGETPVAFAQLRSRSPTSCLAAERPAELNRLYVLSEWHGRGVAQQLMEAILARAAQEQADYLWLGVWERNPKAIAFYRKFGLDVVGEHRFVLGTDPQLDLIMAVAISAASAG